MAGIIGADNQFGQDFGHPTAGLQGTILAVYEVRPCVRGGNSNSREYSTDSEPSAVMVID
jgi:hypothetical protein